MGTPPPPGAGPPAGATAATAAASAAASVGRAATVIVPMRSVAAARAPGAAPPASGSTTRPPPCGHGRVMRGAGPSGWATWAGPACSAASNASAPAPDAPSGKAPASGPSPRGPRRSANESPGAAGERGASQMESALDTACASGAPLPPSPPSAHTQAAPCGGASRAPLSRSSAPGQAPAEVSGANGGCTTATRGGARKRNLMPDDVTESVPPSTNSTDAQPGARDRGVMQRTCACGSPGGVNGPPPPSPGSVGAYAAMPSAPKRHAARRAGAMAAPASCRRVPPRVEP